MNSATLKPVSSQNPSVPNQSNKSMHPQSTPTYSQPSGHMPQNPYPNMNVAHNHPNAQQNHFSLNVPNAPAHYNIGSIPPSNHPVANVNQSATGLQSYTPPKTVAYSTSYQSSLGNSPTQNTASSVSPILPTTQQPPVQQQTSPQNLSHSSTTSPTTVEEISEKPQSNGTSEEKTTETKVQDNHVPSESSKEQLQPPSTVPIQALPQVTEKPKEMSIEKPTLTASFQEKKLSPEPTKVPEEVTSYPTPLATQSVPQQPANVETDPLAIDASETVPSPSKPEEEETSEMPTEDLPEESSEPASIEAVEPQENSSEDASATDADKDIQENDETNTEKSINDDVAETEENVEMDVDKEELTSEKESSSTTIPETKPVAISKKLNPPKPKETTKSAKAESKIVVPKTPTSSKAAEKRQRIRTQPYQSPLPEIEIITKISSTAPKSKSGDDKLIYFYKNEFLAVRNAEGSFYLCQAIQNIYKTSSKIKIRWLSQDKNDKTGEIYTPDFYDLTDFDCILTSLDLARVDKGKYRLTQAEKERTDSILKRSLAVEKGEIVSPSVSQEHPDGLDLSLYKDEEQLKKMKKPVKRKAPSRSSSKKATPTKKTSQAPKVRKVETKEIKKVAPPTRSKRLNTSTTATLGSPPPAITPKKSPPSEPKKPIASTSRSARSKRKSDTKTSPVVDQKKAKVLAKIGRKTAIPASTSRSQSATGKSGKVAAKPIPSSTRAAVVTANAKSSATSRKNKRSLRK